MARIGILNFPGHNNQGANLTAFALQHLLKEWGHEAINLHLLDNYSRNKDPRYTDFADKRIAITPYAAAGNACMQRYNRDFDVFITGSDQVWRAYDDSIFYWKKQFDPCFWLAFAEPGKKRLSMAASFGSDSFDVAPEDEQRFREELLRYTAISVREGSAVPLVERLCGRTPALLIDPVFYLQREMWHNFALPREANTHSGCIAYNAFFNAELFRDYAAQLPEGTELFNLLSGNTEQWLAGIRDARFVITDSFHVTCFCLIFNTPFMCLTNSEQGPARFEELAATFGFSRARIINRDAMTNLAAEAQRCMALPFDTERINKAIREGREKAHAWLREALAAPVPAWQGTPYRKEGVFRRLTEFLHNQQYCNRWKNRGKLCLYALALCLCPIKRNQLSARFHTVLDRIQNPPW